MAAVADQNLNEFFNASTVSDEALLENILGECAKFYAFPDRFRTLTIFDRLNGQFLLMDEGWDGFKHIHRVWLHVELRDGKFWIQKDGTEDGIAVDLMNAGIPKERIVLPSSTPPGGNTATLPHLELHKPTSNGHFKKRRQQPLNRLQKSLPCGRAFLRGMRLETH